MNRVNDALSPVPPGAAAGNHVQASQPRLAPPVRVAGGFVAGFLSVLIFSHGLIAVFYAAGIFPFAPWNLTPVPPLGVPQVLSGAFWGGLWGIAYALLEPRLTARLGWWAGGLVFGAVLPMLVN